MRTVEGEAEAEGGERAQANVAALIADRAHLAQQSAIIVEHRRQHVDQRGLGHPRFAVGRERDHDLAERVVIERQLAHAVRAVASTLALSLSRLGWGIARGRCMGGSSLRQHGEKNRRRREARQCGQSLARMPRPTWRRRAGPIIDQRIRSFRSEDDAAPRGSMVCIPRRRTPIQVTVVSACSRCWPGWSPLRPARRKVR